MSSDRVELCGSTLDGRYKLLQRIGVGGTGVVFMARRLRDGLALAVKTLRPRYVAHVDLGKRLLREAEVARRTRHPGIVEALDTGRLPDGSPYLVMPLLQGEGLSLLLARVSTLPADELAAVICRVAGILHCAHGAGYVHRDVKPEHILLSRTASGQLGVHLLDFGVCASDAAPEEERLREEGKVYGTPSYASPEQAAGVACVDARADLFALGIVMFEALTGELPFQGTTVAKLLTAIMRDKPPAVLERAPQADPNLSALIGRLLEQDLGKRLPSARALARALTCYVGDRVAVEARLCARLHMGVQTLDDPLSSTPAPMVAAPMPQPQVA